MPLTILTDSDVRNVCSTLTRDDLGVLQRCLADALHSYSTATDSHDSGCCASNQPKRISIKRKDGATTLFMPATSDDAMGVKIVTIAESSCIKSSSNPRIFQTLPLTAEPTVSSASSRIWKTPNSSIASTKREDSIASSTNSIYESKSSSISSTKEEDSNTSARTVPILDPRQPIDLTTSSDTSPKGSITLLSPTGQPRALINASTLTAFRTALASSCLLRNRHSVHTITVFGAGLQAYWHLHIALLLRGKEIHHINVINRSFPRAQRLLMALAQNENPAVDLHEKLRPSILTPEYGEYQRLLKENVRDADVIFCCTPSVTPLFPAGHLTNTEGRRKGRYICAIGSYKPHMQELHEDIIRQAVSAPHKEHHGAVHHRHASEGGAVVMDSIDGAMLEAGEIINAGIGGQGLVELGELVMLKRSHWANKSEKEERERETREKEGKKESHRGRGLGHFFGHGKERKEKEETEDDGGLQQWLQKGNVIYKSVGIGLMDVVVGMEIVRLAEERGIGTKVEDF